MAIGIGRRQFISALGGAAVAWPFAARAQQPALPVIGFLSGASPGPYAQRVAGFRQGLNEAGYTEGRNVAIEFRWAEDEYDRLPMLAADLVSRQVAAILAHTDLAAFAAKTATVTIPIIYVGGGDPVKTGLVASLNRPGGNVTGQTFFGVDLAPKRLELLHGFLPKAAVIGLLVDQNNPTAVLGVPEAEKVTRALGLQLIVLSARTASDIDSAFATLVEQRADALVGGAGALFTNHREQIIALAARHAIPAIYAYSEFTADGGLMSYGNSQTDAFRRAGVYAGRILKGTKLADLPVEQSTKFDLVINLKTAKALGLDVPQALLATADEVIE
jgi:putative ABC transport system substrate-binding protein